MSTEQSIASHHELNTAQNGIELTDNLKNRNVVSDDISTNEETKLDIDVLETKILSPPRQPTNTYFTSVILKDIEDSISQEIYIKFGGFRNLPSYKTCKCLLYIPLFYASYFMLNLVLTIIFWESQIDCILLDVTVFAFQAESILLYALIFWVVDKKFMKLVAESLAMIKSTKENKTNAAIHELRLQLLYTILIMLAAYLSGYLFLLGPFKDNKNWYLLLLLNVFDFIRFTPRIVHTALIRSFYTVFPTKLQSIKPKDEDFVVNNDKLIHNQLKMSHNEFIERTEKLIQPYRRNTKEISKFIIFFLVLNILTFTMIIFSALKAFFHTGCWKNVEWEHYLHHLIELASFWCGWVFLVWPISQSHAAFTNYMQEIQAMSHGNPQEKSAIDSYLNGLLHNSPFAITLMGTPTYAKMAKILYSVFVTMLFGILTKIYHVGQSSD